MLFLIRLVVFRWDLGQEVFVGGFIIFYRFFGLGLIIKSCFVLYLLCEVYDQSIESFILLFLVGVFVSNLCFLLKVRLMFWGKIMFLIVVCWFLFRMIVIGEEKCLFVWVLGIIILVFGGMVGGIVNLVCCWFVGICLGFNIREDRFLFFFCVGLLNL